MLRMTKLTDYGIVLLTHLAKSPHAEIHNARDLACATRISLPMANKILKLLAADGLLETKRGVKGGFALARPAAAVTIADIIRALEGPMAITECALPDTDAHTCDRESFCSVRGHTQRINQVILDALSEVTLATLVEPVTPAFFTLSRDPLPPHIAATPALPR